MHDVDIVLLEMKEHGEMGQETPILCPFVVYYIKRVSTWHNDWEHHGKEVVMLESKPFGEERRKLEMKMEDDFIHPHRKHKKNLADVTYKITRICAVPTKILN